MVTSASFRFVFLVTVAMFLLGSYNGTIHVVQTMDASMRHDQHQYSRNQEARASSIKSGKTTITTSSISSSGIRSTLLDRQEYVPPETRGRQQIRGCAMLESPWSRKSEVQTTKLVADPQSDADAQALFQKQPEHSSKSSHILTFFLIYYNDVDNLAQQLASWLKFSTQAKEKMQFLIVDDGSTKNYRAVDVLQAQSAWTDKDIDLVVYEIEQDLVWNIGGARNLGYLTAATEWVFFNDADTIVPPETMDYTLQKLQDNFDKTNLVFRSFHRMRADGIHFRPHPAVMMIAKQAYWTNGGCDEDFIGNYGHTDVHFFYRARKTKSLDVEQMVEEMEPKGIPALRELPDDVTCPTGISCLPRLNVSAEDKPSRSVKFNKRLFDDKVMGKKPWSNEYLRFRWRRVW